MAVRWKNTFYQLLEDKVLTECCGRRQLGTESRATDIVLKWETRGNAPDYLCRIFDVCCDYK